MSRPQLQESEVADLPDKAILATVFSYLKKQNLKDTEDALRKELSHQGDDNTATLGALALSVLGKSNIEPVKYEDSYTSIVPLPTTNHSQTRMSTTAEFPQLAKDSHPTSAPPSTNHIIFPYQQQASLQSSNGHASAPSTPSTPCSAITAPIYPEDEDSVEEESQSSICSPPTLVPITTGLSSFKPLTSSSSSTHNVSSDIFDKNPLWARNASVHSVPTNTSVGGGLGGVTSLSGIPTATSPVYTSIPLSQSLGVRNIMFKSSPATSAVMGSNKNIPVHVPMMYQLTAHPGVNHPLVAPILTMIPPPPPVQSMGGLMNLPSSVFKTTPTSTSIVQSQIGTKLGTMDIENLPDSTSAEFGKMKNKAMVNLLKGVAEPATGQDIPFSEAVQFGSSFCSPSSISSTSSILSPSMPRILASIPHSELTSEQIELKSFAEDFKTRRIKLGFTQGSVGQSLAEKGYSNFAQSTISRFEQMQLSPTNATTIRVVLEQWLLEAESPEIANSLSSCAGSIPVMASRKRKKRAVFAPQTKSTLDTFFCQNPRPNRQVIEEISQQLDLLPEEVRVWFCNKRQKSKPSPVSPIRSLSLGHESCMSSSTSRSTPSPSTPFDHVLDMQQKLQSCSPLKTPFTIEELSKSSNNGTCTTMSSPVRLMSPSKTSMSLVSSDTTSKFVPMLFGHNLSMLGNPLMSPFVMAHHVAQTRA